VPDICHECAGVESVSEHQVKGQGTGVGGVAGGVVGGLLGNQIGHGNGRAAGTLLGALGGAVAGNAIEKETRTTTEYVMVLRFEDGNSKTISQAKPFPFGNGDHVKYIDGQVVGRNR
jgi:outer membrane lipoprotein SlyB